jgi:hypothetical protein
MTEDDLMVAGPWIIFCIGLLILCVLLVRSRRSSKRRLQQRKLDGSRHS